MNITVLVTCAGSGIGQSAIDSLNLNGDYRIIGCDMNRNVYANHFCDDFLIVPSIYSEDYLDFILKLCLDSGVDVIIPGHDHELGLFAKHVRKFKEYDIEIIVSKLDLIEISRDKYEWFRYFSDCGCSIVPTFKVSEFRENPDTSIFPAIVKPVGGSASQGIIIVNEMDDLSLAKDEDIIQPYLLPEKSDKNYDLLRQRVLNGSFLQFSEISIQLVFTKASELAGIFISKNTLRNGIPIFIDPIDHLKFEYLDDIMKFVPVCIEKKVTGPVNIQGRITDKGLYFFEMNMRFTGITGNRAQLGFNEVVFLVNDALNLPASLGSGSKNKLGVREVACTTISREVVDKKVYTILGAGGYIGSNFVYSLIEKENNSDINIVCRDSSYEAYVKRFPDKNIKIVPANSETLESILCGTDVLVNFVGALAYEDDLKQFGAIEYLFDLTQIISRANIPLIINASSQSLYDQRLDIRKTESEDVVVTNSYAFQKLMTEKFFDSVAQVSPCSQVISLRFSRVIGTTNSERKPSGFYTKIIESLRNNEKVQISTPNSKINLIDIRQAVSAIIFIVEKSNTTVNLPRILNVGGTNMSLKEYCDKVVSTLKLETKAKLINYSEQAEANTSSMVSTELIESLGWSKELSIEDTIIMIDSSL